jgi:hypothetical protein
MTDIITDIAIVAVRILQLAVLVLAGAIVAQFQSR